MSALIAPGQDSGKALLLGSYAQGLEILTTSLSNARQNQFFSQQVVGTPAGLVWSMTSAAPGLVIGRTTGLITGTPTAAGSYSVAITANHPTLGSTTTLLRHLVQVENARGRRWKPRFWRWFRR